MTGVTLGRAAAQEAGADPAAHIGRLRLPLLAAYGAGSMVQDVVQFGLNTLLLFYLTIVCGLSGAAAGLALGTALVVDAFVDPLVGSLSDNSRSRHGRRHPWMIASALPTALAFVMLFSTPAGLSGAGLFGWSLVALLAVRVGLSGFMVPYVALGAELSDDYAERSVIVASRVLFSVAATAIGAFLAFGVFMRGVGGQTHRLAYPPFAISSAVVVLAAAATSILGTLGSRGRLHAAPPLQGRASSRLAAEVVEVFRNPSFRVLFLACLILFVGLGASQALALHANTYFWKLPSAAIFMLTLVFALGLLGGVFVCGALVRRLEKRTLGLAGISLIGLCQFAPAALKVGGVIGPAAWLPTLIVSHLLLGLGSSASTIGFQSMMADAADEHEHLFAARREGLYFAGISLSAKASTGIGALIAGLILDLIGFPHAAPGGAPGGPGLVIPAHAVRDLGLLYGPGASLITGASVVILFAYRRSRADHARIREALQARRGAG